MKRFKAKFVLCVSLTVLTLMGIAGVVSSLPAKAAGRHDAVYTSSGNRTYSSNQKENSNENSIKDFADSRDDDCKVFHDITTDADDLKIQQNLPKQLLKKSELCDVLLDFNESQQAYFIQRQRC